MFDSLEPDLRGWDPLLTDLVTRAALGEAVAAIPDSFLWPLLPNPPTSDAAERRRSAYAAFLWKRLRGPRPFGAGAGRRAG